MPRDLTIVLPDRPGALADAAQALGDAGINIDGACGFMRGGETWGVLHFMVEDGAAAKKVLEEAGFDVRDEREVVVVSLEDRPGSLAELARSMAEAGVNIDVIYMTTDARAVIGTDDMHEARMGVKMHEASFGA